MENPKDSRPVPDPTTLTTQQLLREISSIREIIETRIEAMDTAVALLQKTTIDKVPETIAEAVHRLQALHNEKFESIQMRVDHANTHIQALHEEKFRSIQVQFSERDVRAEQTSKDSKVAVDAALQAAKEAVGEQNKSSALAIAKSEAGTTKQIDQIGILITSSITALNDKIDDIKSRLTLIEGLGKGAGNFWSYLIGSIGAAMAISTVILLVLQKH